MKEEKTLQLQRDEKKGRQDWIDLARCIAMLVVMMNHIGLVIRGVNFAGGLFYVPVFFMLSGYVRKHNENSMQSFCVAKAKRLLWPFLITNVVLTVLFLLKDFARGNDITIVDVFGFLYGRNQMFADRDSIFTSWKYINVYFMTHLNSPTWFLPALFLTVVTSELLLKTAKTKDMELVYLIVSILLLAAVCWNYLCPFLFPWSLDALPLFQGLFLAGVLLSHGLWEKLWSHKWIFLILLLIQIPCALINGSANFSIGDYGKSMMLGYFNAVNASVLCMAFCYLLRNHVPKVLAWVGRKTLPLLCWHYPLLTVMEAVRGRILEADGVLLMICKAVEIIVVCALICLADEAFLKIRPKQPKPVQKAD